jgi:hypothetical protein
VKGILRDNCKLASEKIHPGMTSIKRIPLMVLLFLGLHQTSTGQAFYAKTIKVDAKTYATIKDFVNDLQTQLAKATGQEFIIDTKDSSVTSGIQIMKLDPSNAKNYDPRLAHSDAEPVQIESDGTNYLRIKAFSKGGLINGIYTYLDTLGFRWYHPGDEWAYIPHLQDIRLKCNQIFIPDFVQRYFFGTWSYPRNRVIDKDRTVMGAWVL